MASLDYDFDDFVRTSRAGFRLYNNNFSEPQNVSQVYQVCGDRLLILSACLRLLHEQGSVDNGLFVGGNLQAQVNKWVPRIGDFRTTIEELGALIRDNSEDGRPWQAISGEDLSELEKLSASMKKQSRSIHNILVLDRTMDKRSALEILGQDMMMMQRRPVVELPASLPEQVASMDIADEDSQYRSSPSITQEREDDIVSPISPHVLNIPNQKEPSIWGTDVKYSGMGVGVHMANRSGRRPSSNNNQSSFYGINRTNSMSNSSDTGRSQSGSSSRNNSTQTLDSPDNTSPAHSPTYHISHTTGSGNAYFRDRDKVRYDEIAQISGMRIQPALSSRASDSPTNLSADFAPHSPPTGDLVFRNRVISELGTNSNTGSMRIPRRPVSSTGSAGSASASASNTGLHPLATPAYGASSLYDSGAQSPRDSSRHRQRDSSYSDGSAGQSSESGRQNQGSYYRRDSSVGPTAPPRRDSDINTIIEPAPRPRNLDTQAPFYPRVGSRNNSFSVDPYADLPFSPDTFGTDLLSRGQRPESIASKDSKGEDNLRPGEMLIYNGKPQSSNTVDGPYDPSELRVYRNSVTEAYRFVTTVLDNPSVPISHSQHFRSRELELVPEYGYDPLARPILWFREVDDVNNLRRPLEIMPEKEIPALPAYKFRTVPEMLDFQSVVLGEICYLDIETVRFVRLKGAAKETRRIDNTRVQLWHPAPTDKRMTDDAASFVTVGTTRTHANPDIMRLKWSRMMIYLGRSNDFVTVFITDDITLRQSKKGNTLVFEPTKYTGRALFKSRDGVKAKVMGGGRKKGGMRLDMKGLHPDDEENFPMFRTFEIEFEDAESQIRFISVWDQLIKERRRMRSAIEKRKRLAEERVLLAGGGGN
ncbi:hypothetical protein H072_2146 [Dactylellina haptotyla CBS 200.50]|uniref:Uncharacterized protein n=1 Tax=Dactylellina haptotyla (strain CBS 200.50) TaxID=1284197 RepID=S8ALT8_DACHA|nr:hypothetical protein H072_2146 [Dactylellina haptotyla CBS 200.50]